MPQEADLLNLSQVVRSLWVRASGILDHRSKAAIVICPTAKAPAEVGLDDSQRVESCSRWPDLQPDCTQTCLSQAKFSAEDLNDFVARYEGKKCALCGSEITRDDWYKSRLAALNTKAALSEIPEAVLGSSHAPEKSDVICFTCYSTKTRH